MPIIIGKGITIQDLHVKHENMHGKGFEAPCCAPPIKLKKPISSRTKKVKSK